MQPTYLLLDRTLCFDTHFLFRLTFRVCPFSDQGLGETQWCNYKQKGSEQHSSSLKRLSGIFCDSDHNLQKGSHTEAAAAIPLKAMVDREQGLLRITDCCNGVCGVGGLKPMVRLKAIVLCAQTGQFGQLAGRLAVKRLTTEARRQDSRGTRGFTKIIKSFQVTDMSGQVFAAWLHPEGKQHHNRNYSIAWTAALQPIAPPMMKKTENC